MGITAKELDIWCREQSEEQISLLKTLAAIPAPSHNEKARAEFIRDWLLSIGAENVMLDDAWNVIVPFCCNDRESFLLCTAHTDVVFPDTIPLPVREENGKLYAPGDILKFNAKVLNESCVEVAQKLLLLEQTYLGYVTKTTETTLQQVVDLANQVTALKQALEGNNIQNFDTMYLDMYNYYIAAVAKLQQTTN